MDDNAVRRLRTAILVGVALLALLILYALATTPAPLGWMVARTAALFGYSCMFLVILSTEYLREMRKLFGRPFLSVHHVLAVSGLVLILLHPFTVVMVTADPTNLIPQFSSLRTFLTFGGRPAFYLFFLAAIAAWGRGRIKSSWKSIHLLNYVAFTLAFVHSWLLGTDAATGLLRFIWPVMAATALLVMVRRRLRPISAPRKAQAR